MSSLIVQLNNANNWIPFFSASYTAQDLPYGRYRPMPSQILPVQSDERILAVRATSAQAKASWRTGGWLIPLLDLPGSGFSEAQLKSIRVPLRLAGLVQLPDLRTTYTFQFDPPSWMRSVQLEMWQYIGPVDDSTEQLIRQLAQELQINL